MPYTVPNDKVEIEDPNISLTYTVAVNELEHTKLLKLMEDLHTKLMWNSGIFTPK